MARGVTAVLPLRKLRRIFVCHSHESPFLPPAPLLASFLVFINRGTKCPSPWVIGFSHDRGGGVTTVQGQRHVLVCQFRGNIFRRAFHFFRLKALSISRGTKYLSVQILGRKDTRRHNVMDKGKTLVSAIDMFVDYWHATMTRRRS